MRPPENLYHANIAEDHSRSSCSLNRCNLSPWIIGSEEFQANPLPVEIDGARTTDAGLFRLPGIHRRRGRAQPVFSRLSRRQIQPRRKNRPPRQAAIGLQLRPFAARLGRGQQRPGRRRAEIVGGKPLRHSGHLSQRPAGGGRRRAREPSCWTARAAPPNPSAC